MWDIGAKHKVRIDGRGEMTLSPNDHVATGGEGHVYRPKSGTMAVKIWDDPNRAASGRMPEKIGLLSRLKDRRIIGPEALVKDISGRAVGYVMPWVDGWALPLAFTNDWRASNGFGDSEALTFASGMRDVVSYVHSQGIVMGDPNELNILGVNGEPRYIDVDPWVMPGYPGDKILPTIRDWHAPLFSQEADWFAWAVVTFQLLVGVHPYRGSHPDFKRSDLEGRMKANVSVFDSRVTTSPATRPFSSIPTGLLDWYRAVFQGGKRTPPPLAANFQLAKTVITAPKFALMTSGRLRVSEAFDIASPMLRLALHDAILLRSGMLVSIPDGRNIGLVDPKASFVRLADGAVAGAVVDQGLVKFGILNAAPSAVMQMQHADIAARGVWAAANRLFAVTNEGILELATRTIGGKSAMLTGSRWSLGVNSTVFGDGVAVWSALGASHIVVPQTGQAVAIVRARELDGLKALSAVGQGRIAVISLVDKAGGYKRAVVTLSQDLSSCTVVLSDADDGSLADVVTSNGVILRPDGHGKLEVFVPVNGTLMTSDPGSVAKGRLISGSPGVFCALGDKIYRLSMS